MATAQFARACAITVLVFPKKHASDSSITFSLRKRKDWGWASGLCVRSLNHMPARSRPKMLQTEARGSTLLFRQAPHLYDDLSTQFGFCDRRRRVGTKGARAAAPLRRVQERNF